MSDWRCVLEAPFLTAAVVADTDPGWPWPAHFGRCLRCQAQVASVRATRRRLKGMAGQRMSPPPGYELAVIGAIDRLPVGIRDSQPRWVPVATFAGLFAVAIWAWRRNQPI